jgi:hypothetical protein
MDLLYHELLDAGMREPVRDAGLFAIPLVVLLGALSALHAYWALVILDVGVWGPSLVFLLRAVGNSRTFGFFKNVTGTRFAQ